VSSPSFADLTTLRVGGPIREFVRATTTEHLLDSMRAADAAGAPLLVIGGGSNLVVGDSGWDGVTVQVASQDFDIDGTLVHAEAGLDWDALVVATLAEGLAGLECLSAVPGTVGGTPVQNVGAYGALTSDVLRSVTVYDRESGAVEEWDAARCEFGPHRHSRFKHTDRFVVLRVTYELRRSAQSAPLRFAALADRLGLPIGATADSRDVRAAVLGLRRERGYVLDAADHNTWSVGSFFLNPVVDTVPPQAAGSPMYPDELGTKLPAGWLIQHAGFPPGYGRDWGNGTVSLSTRHALSITNRGGATAADVVAFAAHIRAGVEERFGIRLVPECHLVNCSLDEVDAGLA
jgi:UDP-N-acetylmuramate dehydrogenase